MLEGTARELARFGEPTDTQPPQGLQRRAGHRASAMKVQLGHGLAGLGIRCLEPYGQAAVDGLAAFRIAHGAQGHAPRFGQACLGQRAQRLGGAQAAQADDRDRSGPGPRRGRRRQGVDRWVLRRCRHPRAFLARPADASPASASRPVAAAPSPCRRSSRRAIREWIRRSTLSSVLALKGRARMMASARTSPMPSRVMRSSRLALLMSMRLAPGAGVVRV